MAGGLLPVDAAAVHAGAVFGKRLELRAFADLELGDDAVHGVTVDELGRFLADRADVRRDEDRLIKAEVLLLPEKAERRAPADPDGID